MRPPARLYARPSGEHLHDSKIVTAKYVRRGGGSTWRVADDKHECLRSRRIKRRDDLRHPSEVDAARVWRHLRVCVPHSDELHGPVGSCAELGIHLLRSDGAAYKP